MFHRPLATLGAMIAASIVVVGCGGGSGAPSPNTAPARAPASAPATIAAITIPALAPTPPLPPLASLHSTSSNEKKSADLKSSPSKNNVDELSMAGFINLKNTCYANTAFKLLIHSTGPDRLIAHLAEFTEKTESEEKITAAVNFSSLINKAQLADSPITEELRHLLDSLQVLKEFNSRDENGIYKYNIINDQQDVDQFLKELSEIFNLSAIPGGETKTITKLTHNEDSRPEQTITEPSKQVYLKHDGMSLQALVDGLNNTEVVDFQWNITDTENSKAKKSNQLAVDDCEIFDRFTIELVTNHKGYASKINIDQHVYLNILDIKTGKEKIATLEAREVAAHKGRDGCGHYLAYLKNKDGKWTRHDDESVEDNAVMHPREFPRLINFAVIAIKDATSP